MLYMGSKKRYAKDIVPIIQKYIDDNNCKKYLEPFVGGANIIDKIKCEKRIGCDIQKYAISCLNALSKGWIPPKEVSAELYNKIKHDYTNYPEYLTGYIGFNLSFGSKWFGGYVKRNDVKHHGDIYSYKSCIEQQPKLKNITFYRLSFQDIPKDKIKGCVIYCDPPYRDTTSYKTDAFPYEEYYDWCREMSKNNIVLCSEYWMPDDFKCIWSKETTTQINSKRKANDVVNKRTEKLFVYKGE